MSASFYRQHDQWLALQGLQAGHQTLNSQREGSRDDLARETVGKSPMGRRQHENQRYPPQD